jgi:hypothetical protein
MIELPLLGQRYRNVEAKLRDAEWILARIFTGVDGIEYAALEASADRTRRKTLALATVMDPRRFLPLESPAETAAPLPL